MTTTASCPSCGKPLALDAPKGLCQECLLKAGFPTGTEQGSKQRRFAPLNIKELTPKFPQLEMLEFIGQGGMGAVYKARQRQLDRVVALKILPPQAANEAGFAGRFTREARALARLNHPHIVTLYEFGQTDGLFYFLMEFVNGVNLRQLLDAGRMATKEALAIVPQICEALQFAHDAGIVHRDIKPENILLDKKGRVKIADFGIVKVVGYEPDETSAEKKSTPAGELTQAGTIIGTPQYMAPEQTENSAEVDHRSDIYSLGVVFYQMLTGELPVGKFEPPSKKAAVDVRLDEVVLRALEKKPELRFQQASQVKEEVAAIVQTQSVSGSANKPQARSAHSHRTSLALLLVVLLGIFALLLPHWWHGNISGKGNDRVAPFVNPGSQQTLAEQPPVVVETWPVAGARDVEPGAADIRVRFSRKMTDKSWSWCPAWEDSAPETTGPAAFDGIYHTCALPVKLEPGRTYGIWLNTETFKNFQDESGRPAVPYLLVFKTKSTNQTDLNSKQQ